MTKSTHIPLHRIVLIIATTTFLGFMPKAGAETFVFSGDGAGQVGIFETAQTSRQFYNSVRRSATFAPADGANFFFHRDTRDGTVSFLLLADRFEDGTNGSLAGTITGLPTDALITRSDDASELEITSPGIAVFDFVFNTRGIDGGVISGLDPNNLNFNINITGASGLTSTNLIDPSGITSLGVVPTAGLSFVASSPEPETWALFILSFCGVAAAAKRRRRTMNTIGLVTA